MRERLGIGAESKVIVMVARFAENKRHDLMLDAFQQVREQVPTARLVLKGEVYSEDAYYDSIKKRIDEMNSDNSILHIPFVDDIREIHAAADVLVLCSDREGLGRCVVEAMCMGIPPVVTDTGGVTNHRRWRKRLCGSRRKRFRSCRSDNPPVEGS